MTHVEITGPPQVDANYMGRPIRVPLNRTPDTTWQVRLSLAPRSERIRYAEVEGDALLVFPAHGWADREAEVLDMVMELIDHANRTYFEARRAREEADARAGEERARAEQEREGKLADWWQSRHSG
ncbi:MAG: hypothetical protein M3155_05825 [Actinomycetota bacterium]|nr:hypothetical protein [Actinomycetota bacterium]